MLLGLFSKIVAQKTGIPYTLLITIIGLALGGLAKDLGTVGEGLEEWSEMGAHDILLIFLPALIFESAFSVNWHIMRKQLG